MNARGSWLWVATAIAAAAAVMPMLSPGIIGLFHDDAVYVATAQSLAEGNGYRLVNLPGAPAQTKYPPLFPQLLALVWKSTPAFPANAIALKSLNLVFIAILLVAMVKLIQIHVRNAVWPALLLSQLVLVTNPGIMSFADYTTTDVCFTMLVTVSVVLWGRGEPRRREELALLALIAIAILIRSVGISLAAALVVMSLIQRRYRQSLLYATVAIVAMTSWTLWASLHRSSGSVLLDYYQAYETPAVVLLFSDPLLAWRIVIGNCRLAIDSLPAVLGPAWTFTWPLLLAASAVGCYRLARSGGGMIVVFTVCYLGVVLLHPFAPHRYLLPLVPLFVLTLVVGVWPQQIDPAHGSPRRAVAFSAALLAILLAGNLLWLRETTSRSQSVRGWYGMDMGYAWSGFQETF